MNKPRKPTANQLVYLRSLAERRPLPLPAGRSSSGGWSTVVVSCYRRGYLDRDGITAAGRAVLEP